MLINIKDLSNLKAQILILVRKFVSLLVSIWYFDNEFTAVHWLGTTLVFGGTLVFSEVHRKTFRRPLEDTKKTLRRPP